MPWLMALLATVLLLIFENSFHFENPLCFNFDSPLFEILVIMNGSMSFFVGIVPLDV
jgi:hypothetical protein